MRRSLFALLLAASFTLPAYADPLQVSGEAAWPNTTAQPDPRLKHAAYPLASVATTHFSAPETARIDALRVENSESVSKVLKIGLERSVRDEALSSDATPAWHALPDGGHVARLDVTSPGAVALRAGLDIGGLPAGAELRFFGSDASRPDPDVVAADEFERQRSVQARVWGPVTFGERQSIELFLPAGADPRWTSVSLEAISHLFISPTGRLAGAKIGESDSCEFDARCITNPSAAYNNAKNAVARMVFQSDGSSALCTGTLLNDTVASTQIPHFFGAAHCFTTQSVASSLTTFWFYEATACGSGVLDGAARQVSGGATVQFASTGSDVLFVRLNSTPPPGAYYMGWNSASLATGNEILVLHHPAGDVKKVSLGQVKGFGSSNLASGQFIKVGYTNGTTEGGSSGCGLLTNNGTEYQLRGGLLGGSAGCANTGTISNPDNSDDFSRFDQVFPSLQSFLAPSTTQPPSTIDYSGAWSNPAQDGWGLIVVRGASGTYAMYIYHYDEQSSPSWYLTAGNLSGTSYSQSVLSFTGPWFGLSSFNPAAVTNRVSGSINVNFTSATTATISFTIDGRSVSTSLAKLAF